MIGKKTENRLTAYSKQVLEQELTKAQESLKEASVSIGDSGDDSSSWHDSANFDFAHRQTELFTTKVATLRLKLRDVAIITPRMETDNIGIGNTVEVRFKGEPDSEVFTLLGPDDATRQPGWISYESLLGNNLVGKRVKETFEYGDRKNRQHVTVLKILPGQF